MNARDFYKRVAKKVGLHHEVIQNICQVMVDEGIEVLREMDEVRIPKVGKFFLKEMEAKDHVDRFAAGRGERVVHHVQRHYLLKFEAFDSFHRDVNWDVVDKPAEVDEEEAILNDDS